MSYYMHNVPGRLRVKTSMIKGKQNMADQVLMVLRPVEGVTSVTASTVTGSILINYDEKTVSSRRILQVLAEYNIFDHTRATTHDQYVHRAASKVSKSLGKVALGAALDAAFEGSALSLLAVLL